MTAEVVVMNKGAVSLAADSAVTMQGGKIFNSANKLFMLAPGHPIGILLYNNTELMQIPWEILIKQYRDHVKKTRKRFATLESCGDDFIQYLRQNADELFPLAQQQRFVGALIQATMRDDIRGTIRAKARDFILKYGAKVTDDQFEQICHEVIESVCLPWLNAGDLQIATPKDELENRFFNLYGTLFDENYKRFLAPLPITDADKEQLKQLCVSWVYKERWFLSMFSGIVFAGYGDTEMFPCCVAYQTESYLCGELKYSLTQTTKIDNMNITVALSPFAQQDMVATFISGIHPDYVNVLNEHLLAFATTSFPDALLNQMAIPDDNQRAMLRQAIIDLGQQKLNEELQQIEQQIRQKYTQPILEVVAVLSKEDLAMMAETLVNITSFMRRVSRVQETVGGPTDVAVISKKDGFIWIKRKHYFDKDRNYHFFRQQNTNGD